MRERSHSLSSLLSALHMLSASLSVTRSFSPLSLSSFLLCDSFLGLFMCVFSSVSHRLFNTCASLSFSLFLMLSVSLSLSPRLIGRGAPVAVIG